MSAEKIRQQQAAVQMKKERQLILEKNNLEDKKLATVSESHRLATLKVEELNNIIVSFSWLPEITLQKSQKDEMERLNKLTQQEGLYQLTIQLCGALQQEKLQLVSNTEALLQQNSAQREEKEVLEKQNRQINAELDVLKRRQMSISSGGVDSLLQEDLDLYKQLYTCSVCHKDRVSSIITSCDHAFCDECIEKQVKARNRKCPRCQSAFSTSAVHKIYFS